MNCRECQHVAPVHNSIHCSCKHPQALQILSDHTHLKLHMERLSTGERFPRNMLDITLDHDYEKMVMLEGYCLWPINFDPRWIESCSGFTARSGEINVKGVCCGHAIR